jgi:hypothetical protein
MSGRPGPIPRARSPPPQCCSCHGRHPRHLHAVAIDTMSPHRKRQVILKWRKSGAAAWRLNENQSDFLRPQPEWCGCACHPEDQRGRPLSTSVPETGKRKTRGPDKFPRKRKQRAHSPSFGSGAAPFADWTDARTRLQAWVEQQWECESHEVQELLYAWLKEHGGWGSVLVPRAMCFNAFMVSAVCADSVEACKRFENRRSQHMGLAILHQSLDVESADWAPTVAQVYNFDPLRLAEEGLSQLGGVSRAVAWLEPAVGQQCSHPELANVWRTFHTSSSGAVKHGWWRRVAPLPAGLLQVKGSLSDFSVQGAIQRGLHASHYSCAVAMLLDGALPPGWLHQAESSTLWDRFVSRQHQPPPSGTTPASCTKAATSCKPSGTAAAPTQSSSSKYQLQYARHQTRSLSDVHAIFRHCTGQPDPSPHYSYTVHHLD